MAQFVTVNLGSRQVVNAIATQGHGSESSGAFVSAYHVSASDDGTFWRSVHALHHSSNKQVRLGFWLSVRF